MHDFEQIRTQLGAFRRRWGRIRAAEALCYGLAAAGWLALGALWLAATTGASGTLRAGSLAALLVAALGPLVWRVVLRGPRRGERDVARAIGARAPELASDLLSTVELESTHTGASPELVSALAAQTRVRLEALPLAVLVPGRPARLAALVLLAATAAAAPVTFYGREALARGAKALLTSAGRLSGSEIADGPLVGDLQIQLSPPKHTGLPERTIADAVGDVSAPRGTKLRITGRALRPASRVLVVLSGGAAGERVLEARGEGRVEVALSLDESLTYRFALERRTGRTLEEPGARRLDAELDRVPRVDAFAPEDDLELDAATQVEVGYDVDDDYGLAEVALHWRLPDGKEHARVLEKPAGERKRQGTTVLDVAALGAPRGARITYWVSALDNDEPVGKRGQSRVLSVRVVGERERRADQLEKLAALREKLLGGLADRLEAPPGDARTLLSAAERDRPIAELAAGAGTGEGLGKSARATLSAIATRHRGLDRAERELAARAGEHAREIGKANDKRVNALEGDAIAVDDLLSRSRLEDLAALARDAQAARDRLKDLLARAASTKDPALKQEIAREVAAIEERMQRLAEQIAKLQEKREVPDEFLNSQVPKESEDALAQIKKALEKGDYAEAQRKLDELGKQLDQLASVAGQDLKGLSSERFGPEEKAMQEVASEVADLERDQAELEKASRQVMEEARQRNEGGEQKRADKALAKLREKAEKLRKKLREAQPGVPTWDGERAETALKRAADLERALQMGDFQEALDQARQTRGSLAELGRSLDEDSALGMRAEARRAREKLGEAEPLAEELVRDLEQALPQPGESLSGEDRKKLGQIAGQQQSLRERAQKLAERAEQLGKQTPAPGLEGVGENLKKAGEPMRSAEGRLRGGMPQPAVGDQHAAKEQLGKIKQQLQQEMQPGGRGREGSSGKNDEVVRIPGAEQWKGPREFRAELMEAMKEADRAPERYRRQVKRYYEEIAR